MAGSTCGVRVRILRTNRTEFLVLVDGGQDFESLFAEWCLQDDDFASDRIREQDWTPIDVFLRDRGVTVLEPCIVQKLADYYSE